MALLGFLDRPQADLTEPLPVASVTRSARWRSTVSDRSQLPVWTPIWTGDTYIDELPPAPTAGGGCNSSMMTRVKTRFPRVGGSRPVDALDHVNFIEHVGGGRDFELAAMRIDAREVAGEPGFRYRMGLDEPELWRPPTYPGTELRSTTFPDGRVAIYHGTDVRPNYALDRQNPIVKPTQARHSTPVL